MGQLLREADPLRHESIDVHEQRERSRRVVLAAASQGDPAARINVRSRSRVGMLAAACGLALVAFAGWRAWSPQVTAVQAAVRFEARLAEDAPAPGLRELKVSGSRSIYVDQEAIVNNSDVAAARVVRGPAASEYNVVVTFTTSGAAKMRAATGRHIGKPVAILIDGQVTMAPVVRTPIAETAVISGNLTKAQAGRIARGIAIR